MAASFCLKSRAVRRLLSIIMICALLPKSAALGALQPPLSRITNPVFGTSGGTVPATVPTNLSPYIKDIPAAIRLGKALFWDMQVGSDGTTACASCHYRAGADPITAPVFDQITSHKRNKNQLHPGPDAIFGNNSTVIRTFDPLSPLTPKVLRATGLPQFTPNYTLQQGDFPLFKVNPPFARLVLVDPVTGQIPIDPLTAITTDAVTNISDTNDVVGSQGIRLNNFLAINNTALDTGTPLVDQIFHTGPTPIVANNVRQVTGRNTPSVINSVFNYTNFWDGRANNIFNGVNPFGPLDQGARIYIDNGGGAPLVTQAVSIPNASLASQAVGPPLNSVEMSFVGRTFPELGRKMMSLTPLAKQHVDPNDSVLGAPLAIAELGLNTKYSNMIKAAFQANLTSNTTVNLPTKAFPGGESFTQIEANFSLFWGLAIQLYEATLVSDRTPFDRFQLGNQNALSVSEQRGFTTFDSKCAVCHSGSEFTSAVVGSNLPNCLAPDCNRVAFTNNTTHNLIKQDANPTTFAVSLIDNGFFNIGVRPTADNPGRGGNAPSGQPLSFSKLAVLQANNQLPTGLVTPILPAGFVTMDNVQGSFKTPGLRNVELTAPYFHNGDALTLDQVVEFYSRGGNFPNNPELAAAMQPIKNLANDPTRRADIVAFLKRLTDDRVRNETAPFDHPELVISDGVDVVTGSDILITLPATGGGPAPVAPLLTVNPVVTPTNLVNQVISGTVVDGTKSNDTVTVAVSVTNLTAGISLPTAAAIVGGTVGGVAGGVTQLPTDWSINLTGMIAGFNSITVTATSITGATATVSSIIQVMPTATISGTPLGGSTNQNSATLTIGGGGVISYQYSLDGVPFIAVPLDTPVSKPITLSGLADGPHTVAVLGKDAGGIQQVSATTATWTVKVNPPVLTLNATSSPTGSSTQTISGTVELGPIPSVSVVNTSATASPVNRICPIGDVICTWSCDITGLVGGANNVTVTALDFVFNTSTVKGVITRVLPDGNFKGTGVVDIYDALKALRISVGLITATPLDLLHGDVAPLVNGVPAPDNSIDIADALLILRKLVGLVTF